MTNDINSVPSYNPADLETQSGTMNYILRCNNMNNSVCIPAIVESYDREKNIVTVIPAITITATTGETLERESITATVMSICGGNFIMNFSLSEGDTGWLITADRDISLFIEQRKVINANTNRIHSIEDSFFIPDRVNDFKIEEEDENNLVIQNLDRNVKISLGDDEIKITNKTKQKEEEDNEPGEGNISKDESSTNDSSSNNGTSQNEDTQEQSDEATISIREGEIGIEITGEITIKAEKKDGKESTESDQTTIYMNDQELLIETTDKVTINAKNNVFCTVAEGDIECECQNLRATVEEDVECECKNLKATVAEDIECECQNLTAEVESNAQIKAETITLDGDVNISGNLSIDGQTDCSGDLSISGNTDCSGNISGSSVQAGGIDLEGHVHSGVEPGSGTTGGAQ